MITETIYKTLVSSGVNVEQTLSAVQGMMGGSGNPEVFWKHVAVYAGGGVVGGILGMIIGNKAPREEAEDLGVPLAALGNDTRKSKLADFTVGFGAGVAVVAATQFLNIISSEQ